MAFHFKGLAAAAVAAVTLAACEPVSGGGGTVVLANKNVLIENQTGRTIWRFYGSPVTTNSWEEDILGSSVLPNGQTININFDDGRPVCNYDMRAEFRDGSAVERRNVNVCTTVSVTFR